MTIATPSRGQPSVGTLAPLRDDHSQLPPPQADAVRLDGRYWKQVGLTTAPLMLADGVALLISALVAVFFTSRWIPAPAHHVAEFTMAAWGAMLAAFVLTGLYPLRLMHPAVELRQIFRALVCLALSTALAAGLAGGDSYSPYITMALLTFGLCTVLIPMLRSFVRSLVVNRRWWGYPAVVIGDAHAIDTLAGQMLRRRGSPLKVRGRFTELHRYWEETQHDDLPFLGPIDDVVAEARRQAAYWVLVAMPDQRNSELLRWMDHLRSSFPHVLLVQSQHEWPGLWAHPVSCQGLSGVQLVEPLLMPGQRWMKRMLDLSILALASPIVVPLMLLLALMVKLTSRGPVFYRHHRLGRESRVFGAWKFRTMVPDADRILKTYLQQHPELEEEWNRDQKLKDDPRITPIGKLLRKTSLDELPQLWNVLRGHMSLVGPRPIVADEVVKYGTTYHFYERVRPGITGMWQISGRNNTTYAERLALDRFYVRNWSPWLDVYILIRTIKTVLFCEGAY
jgi:Undecaprenyl-phosphate galactose phosphotransferase WbaP